MIKLLEAIRITHVIYDKIIYNEVNNFKQFPYFKVEELG